MSFMSPNVPVHEVQDLKCFKFGDEIDKYNKIIILSPVVRFYGHNNSGLSQGFKVNG